MYITIKFDIIHEYIAHKKDIKWTKKWFAMGPSVHTMNNTAKRYTLLT